MNVREVKTQTDISPIFIAMARKVMASELGLKPRTEKEMEDFRPGYYMDLNGNLAIVNSVTKEEDGGSIEILGDIDTVYGGSELANEINIRSVHYWEYLGPL